jgi:hypothetical protein
MAVVGGGVAGETGNGGVGNGGAAVCAIAHMATIMLTDIASPLLLF